MDFSTLTTSPAALDAVYEADLPPIDLPSVGQPGAVSVEECDELLVPVDPHLHCINAYRATGWPGTNSTTWLRESVVRRLVHVTESLPAGFGLAVFDGWRSMETIRALYSHFYGPGSTLAPGFLADPDRADSIPPHLTGGAVDLTLTWHGTPLSLGTPFDEFSDRAHLCALEPDGAEPDRSLRRLLWSAMVAADFTPYREEWWHYSWGDVDWAAAHGEPIAAFGVASPPA